MPLVRRTRATLRSAEFGFFGVIVYTRVQTPRRCGAATFFLRPLPDFRPGVVTFLPGDLRPLRISWLVVGMRRVMVAAGRWAPSRRAARRERLVERRVGQPDGLGHRRVGDVAAGDVDAARQPRVAGH